MTRIRFSFARTMALSYLSHLDMLRLFLRALSRSGLPLAYSKGYNPHPRFNLALPLPLGITAGAEYGEVFLTGEISPELFVELLKMQLPEGLVISGASVADQEAPALPSLVNAALYRAVQRSGAGIIVKAELLQAAVDRLMSEEQILLKRKTKKKKTTYTNVRPFILEAAVGKSDNELLLNLLLQAGSQGGVSPVFVIEQLEPEPGCGRLRAYDWHIHRDRLYFKNNGILQPFNERV